MSHPDTLNATPHDAILKANERYHDQEAEFYDSAQPFIRNSFAQRMFLRDIDLILKTLSKVEPDVRVLDCGAGTGNLTMKFLQRGCSVTAVDISAAMLKALRRKADALPGARLTIVHSDIDSYLNTTPHRFNVVCSSSFLHHLPDYTATYGAIARVCDAEAIVYTAFEPYSHSHLPRPGQWLMAADSCMEEFFSRQLYSPFVVGRAALRRLGVLSPPPSNVLNEIDHSLIERPALGIDTKQLAATLRAAGFGRVALCRRSIMRRRLTFLLAEHLVHLNNALFLMGQRSQSGRQAPVAPPGSVDA